MKEQNQKGLIWTTRSNTGRQCNQF